MNGFQCILIWAMASGAIVAAFSLYEVYLTMRRAAAARVTARRPAGLQRWGATRGEVRRKWEAQAKLRQSRGIVTQSLPADGGRSRRRRTGRSNKNSRPAPRAGHKPQQGAKAMAALPKSMTGSVHIERVTLSPSFPIKQVVAGGVDVVLGAAGLAGPVALTVSVVTRDEFMRFWERSGN